MDENVHVVQWHGYFSVILIAFLSTCGVVSTSGKMMIVHYILTQAPKRPLNKMILCDQLGQLLTRFGFILLTLTSLMESTPIQDLIPNGCQIFYCLTVARNTLLVSGGFMIALFRMFCVKFSSKTISNLSSIVDIILWIQYGLVIFLLIGYYYSTVFFGMKEKKGSLVNIVHSDGKFFKKKISNSQNSIMVFFVKKFVKLKGDLLC